MEIASRVASARLQMLAASELLLIHNASVQDRLIADLVAQLLKTLVVFSICLARVHGRNAETWNAKGTAAFNRFNYDYSDEELEQFVEKMERLARHVQLVQGIFNSNFEDQGQRSAASLKRMLGGEAPPPLMLS